MDEQEGGGERGRQCKGGQRGYPFREMERWRDREKERTEVGRSKKDIFLMSPWQLFLYSINMALEGSISLLLGMMTIMRDWKDTRGDTLHKPLRLRGDSSVLYALQRIDCLFVAQL